MQRGRGRGRGSWASKARARAPAEPRVKDISENEELVQKSLDMDKLDATLGYEMFPEDVAEEGWLVNIENATRKGEASGSKPQSGIDLYFVRNDGSRFKTTLVHKPYIYVGCREQHESVVEAWLTRTFGDTIVSLERIQKEDLQQENHLRGLKRTYIKVSCATVAEMRQVTRTVVPLAAANAKSADTPDTYTSVFSGMHELNGDGGADERIFAQEERKYDAEAAIMDIREYDITYYLRVTIDRNIRVGLWYNVTPRSDFQVDMVHLQDRVKRAEPVVMAYDIETTKAPLKFPDSAFDQIMMISLVVDGQGALIINREIVSQDIADFGYRPTADMGGPFRVFNVANEVEVIKTFFASIQRTQPSVMATYNGDFFDFPFVAKRATAHGLDMYEETGFFVDDNEEFKNRTCAHMDCFRWVKRDSYLPQGSQGLKAVTTAKLGYHPDELDPELMTPYAFEQPDVLAQYSVSDAVATYHLYMIYVHPFIFSLCNIIPMNPDDVLRKGTGTLCETLLMVEAHHSNVIMPNRHVENNMSMFDGHLLESETYVGGHVEALEAGVFRKDLATDFKLVPSAFDQLISQLDDALQFSITVEEKKSLDDIENYEEVRDEIRDKLLALRNKTFTSEPPMIYHLDVAAMYPNIMLSNRLQPDAVVTEATCMGCDFNHANKRCDRRLKWAWRGEYFPAKLGEFKMIRNALENESFPGKGSNGPSRRFSDLAPSEQTALLHKRLSDYSRQVYNKIKESRIINKEAIICQRENPFYIDTLRTFRDRRYIYKGLHKEWKGKLGKAKAAGNSVDVLEANAMIVLYDSLQLAHKCILNSFYGYVMRKGARWFSMEMAGITCLTGATIIQMARSLVDQIGKPLELDTDGIWCLLPGSFPEDFTLKLKNGKSFTLSYPCTMLNHLVHRDFTNHQYHELEKDSNGELIRYSVRSENSIFFELDGPYRAMVLPASKEEDKLLKKRYAVFNDNGSLAELKGFEIKRRGELQLIKDFQSEIFSKFLQGDTLKECYDVAALTANAWLDILFTKGKYKSDQELIALIVENRSMSKTLADYGSLKSTSITAARRLAEFLGESMVKDKGLSCRFVISEHPLGSPVAERAVPITIFAAEDSLKQHYLRKWLRNPGLTDFDIRSILDWDYYIERLGSVVQKLITIPAALQRLPNPVPRIGHPDWLSKRVLAQGDKYRQFTLEDMLQSAKSQDLLQKARESAEAPLRDLEDSNGGREEAMRRFPAAATAATAAAAPVIQEPPSAALAVRDFGQFLTQVQPFWLKAQSERNTAKRTASRRSLGALTKHFAGHNDSIASQVWDIVKIAPLDKISGEVRVWLHVNGAFYKTRLHIPKVFYVNLSSVPKAPWPGSCEHEIVSRTLPRGHTALTLVQIKVDADEYERHASDWQSILSRPEVLGVYELGVPSIVRGIIRLGATCVTDRGASMASGLERGFAYHELKRPPIHSNNRLRSYLSHDGSLSFAVLLHQRHGAQQHVFLVIMPDGQSTLVFVEPRGAQVPNALRLESFYEEQLVSAADNEWYHYPKRLVVGMSQVHSLEQASKAITDAVSAWAKANRLRRKSLIVQVNSPQPEGFFHDVLSDVYREYAMSHISTPQDKYPPLMWHFPAAKSLVQRYLRFSRWVQERMTLSKSFDIPYCNLSSQDPTLDIMDVELARKCDLQGFVMWWSDQVKPDLGGRQEDTNTQGMLYELGTPQVNTQSCVTRVSLELEIGNLAANSILQASSVYNLDGIDASEQTFAFENVSYSLDDYARGAVGTTFELGETLISKQMVQMISSLVKMWSLQSSNRSGPFYRHLVDNFWRWISSPSAKLYDPALHRFVYGLMQKAFSSLLSEFNRLGCSVVYADFSKVILATRKTASTDVDAFSDYLIATVKNRELFRFVKLHRMNVYDCMLWLDAFNFGAIAHGQNDALDITMEWNIASFLPPEYQKWFNVLIADFMQHMYREVVSLDNPGSTPARKLVQSTPGGNTVQMPQLEKEIAQFIRGPLKHKLFHIVTALKKPAKSDDARFVFPARPGRLLDLKNGNLEFIKMVCAVLDLYKATSTDVRILKRNLLNLVGATDFGDEAEFKNPSYILKLPNIVCGYCASSRTLDIFRDTNVSENMEWFCEYCGTLYDGALIETALITHVLNRIALFQLQDLRCDKCKQIAASGLASACQFCAGKLQLTSSRADFLRFVHAVRELVAVSRFDKLGAVLDTFVVG